MKEGDKFVDFHFTRPILSKCSRSPAKGGVREEEGGAKNEAETPFMSLVLDVGLVRACATPYGPMKANESGGMQQGCFRNNEAC